MKIHTVESTHKHSNSVQAIEEKGEDAGRDTDTLSINSAALGDDLPPGYFYSLKFIGTLAVRAATYIALLSSAVSNKAIGILLCSH